MLNAHRRTASAAVAAFAVAASLAGAALADSTPVGPLPAGPTSTIQTQKGGPDVLDGGPGNNVVIQ